jgi:hypothetical protein
VATNFCYQFKSFVMTRRYREFPPILSVLLDSLSGLKSITAVIEKPCRACRGTGMVYDELFEDGIAGYTGVPPDIKQVTCNSCKGSCGQILTINATNTITLIRTEPEPNTQSND